MDLAEKIDVLMKELDQGISLPANFYTDAAIVDLEVERIFRKTWQYVGSAQELKSVGDYVTAYVGNVPVVVVRNDNGIEAFVNVCRHRRHEVMKGCGNSSIMQCRYHAWTYDLNGCLKAAPRADREPDFNVADYPLLSIRCDKLGPFIFVNFDENAKPVANYYGKVLDVIAGSGIDLDALECYSRDSWSSNANWKTMLENYLECYHCPVAHPGFSAAIDVDPDSYKLESYDWFFTQVGAAREADAKAKARVKTYDTSGEIVQSQYHLLWPNCTININPGFPNLSIDVWNPDGPHKAQGFSTQFFAPGVDKKWAEELVQFNIQVGREDDDLTDSVQRGLMAGIPERGRFLKNSEHLIVDFQKLVVKSLAAAPSVVACLLVVLAMFMFQTLPVYAQSFSPSELQERFLKPKYKDLADKVLVDCANRKFEQAMTDGMAFAKAAKPKRIEIDQFTSVANERVNSGNRDVAVALLVLAYQSIKVSGKMTADESIWRIYQLLSIVGSVKTTESDRVFSNDLIVQALQTRKIAGGLLDADAPAVLLHARLEFSLKHWDASIKEYEFWIGMYDSKGKKPPANDLPDALAELGIAYTNLKNLTKAESYFKRACEASMALSNTTVTQVNQYDVEDFLIFNYLSQGKLDLAKERAQQHLTFKEKMLGYRSPKLAEELNRYADLFEQAGDNTYSFSLRSRAGRVTAP